MDLIDRQEAIEAIVKESHKDGAYGYVDASDATKVLNALPSAQPERLTDDDFETIRIHLSAYKEQLGNQSRWEEAEEYQRIIDRFMSFASAQPEPHESFTDLIDRQAAIDALDVLCQEHRYKVPGKRETYSQYNEAWQDALDRAEGAIGNLPATDIDLSDFSDRLWRAAYERGKAEVVRCKDCKYFDSGTDEDGKLFFKCLGWVYGGTSEDDFCSHGERKDG